jgi:pyrroloquinoline quinone biosynthesis protein B
VRARAGSVESRSQASIAVSADGERWSILGASPDIRDQLARFSGLHPRPGTRDVPLDSVVLTNAELDQALGLLVLREALSYRIVSTPWVRDAFLEYDAAWRLLAPVWGAAKIDAPIRLDREGQLEARFFPTPGKVPNHLKDLVANHSEASVGVRITDRASDRRLVYAPGAASLDGGTRAELEAADCRIVDGTFFSPDELQRLRPGAVEARTMGHVPMTGRDSSLDILRELSGRTLYIHMNNTNPVLDARSAEAAVVRAAGIELAEDGAELTV